MFRAAVELCVKATSYSGPQWNKLYIILGLQDNTIGLQGVAWAPRDGLPTVPDDRTL